VNSQILIAGGGALFGLMLIVALLVRRGGVRKGNRLLAASLAGALGLLVGLILIRADLAQDSGLSSLLISLYLLSPAFMLGYVRALIRPGFSLQPSDSIHLLPAIGFAITTNLLAGDNMTIAEAMEQARGGWPPNTAALLGILLYVLQVLYFSRAMLELRAHQRQVIWDFSYDENITLRWLQILLGISLLLSSIGLVITLVRLLPGVELWPRSIYSMSMVILIYYLIGFMGLSQPAIFDPVAEEDHTPRGKFAQPGRGAPEATRPALEEGALPAEVETHYWTELQAHMGREKPFLDNKLRIADLAGQLDMPVHHLSQTINRRAGESFSEFINRHRVDAAKGLLNDPEKPIAMITFDAGFNSESAFYRHFKNFTGQTPKQYRRELQPQANA
jgi:AraC-like DNA-binding protein